MFLLNGIMAVSKVFHLNRAMGLKELGIIGVLNLLVAAQVDGIIPRVKDKIQDIHMRLIIIIESKEIIFLKETREVHVQSKEASEEFNVMPLHKVELMDNKPLEVKCRELTPHLVRTIKGQEEIRISHRWSSGATCKGESRGRMHLVVQWERTKRDTENMAQYHDMLRNGCQLAFD